jgi:hypothetical protein
MLPSSFLSLARESDSLALVSGIRFCIECDAEGVPCLPEPLDEVQLWCDLLGWGRVHVGSLPVPYDEEYRCTFPPIRDAAIHTMLTSSSASAPSASAHDHVVSLRLVHEPQIMVAIQRRLLGPHAAAAAPLPSTRTPSPPATIPAATGEGVRSKIR